MGIESHNLPTYQSSEGDYRHVFSYHPMDIPIARRMACIFLMTTTTATLMYPVDRWR